MIDNRPLSAQVQSTVVDKVENLGEKNERTFHNTDSAYVLPNDNVEHHRLEKQHHTYVQLMGGKILHAPLGEVRKSLDIGCGTGIITHEIATRFPAANVYGIDLSPVPQVRERLSNIAYIQGNIMKTEDSVIQEGTFDLVFSRFLILGMTEWEAYIQRCVSLTRPGGWIEMHDASGALYQVLPNVSSLEHLRPHTITTEQLVKHNHPTDQFYVRTPLPHEVGSAKLLGSQGMDFYCGENIPLLFEKCGLVDISITRYLSPWGTWDELTDAERNVAEYTRFFGTEMLPLCIRKAAEKAPEHTKLLDQTLIDISKFMDAYDGVRTFMWVYAVHGRKPEGGQTE